MNHSTEGRWLDMIAATGHDIHARQDYQQLVWFGIRTVRDGVRWHLIDRDGDYDWSSIRPMLKAAKACGTQRIWDLLHYGWPDYVDIWSPLFVDRFARYDAACAHVVREESDVPLEGICLYPIVNHPGWDDNRACENGLLSAGVTAEGNRTAYEPLAAILKFAELL